MTKQLTFLYSGDHRLPLDHQCSQWSRVDQRLLQCETCQHLIKAPETEKFSPEEYVNIYSRALMKRSKLLLFFIAGKA
jgi:hypothetical protein